jgi:hypothetical protein
MDPYMLTYNSTNIAHAVQGLIWIFASNLSLWYEEDGNEWCHTAILYTFCNI